MTDAVIPCRQAGTWMRKHATEFCTAGIVVACELGRPLCATPKSRVPEPPRYAQISQCRRAGQVRSDYRLRGAPVAGVRLAQVTFSPGT